MVRRLIIGIVILSAFSSYAPAQGGCPPYPVTRQCDPGDGSSCSTSIIPPGPYIYGVGPWKLVGVVACCGESVPGVVNYYPSGCYATELRTKESQHNVLAMLVHGNDIFLLDRGGTLVKFNARPVPIKRKTDLLTPSLHVEQAGGE
jgi:hypothetical protein